MTGKVSTEQWHVDYMKGDLDADEPLLWESKKVTADYIHEALMKANAAKPEGYEIVGIYHDDCYIEGLAPYEHARSI